MSPVTPTDLDRRGLVDRLRLAAEVVATYGRVRMTMRGLDPESAVDTLRRGARRGTPTDVSEDPLVASWRLAQATQKTLMRLPSDSRCLFRSLTLMCMLERRRIDGTLVIAVRPRPFAAHAWIEVEGSGVLPVADPGYERLAEL